MKRLDSRRTSVWLMVLFQALMCINVLMVRVLLGPAWWIDAVAGNLLLLHFLDRARHGGALGTGYSGLVPLLLVPAGTLQVVMAIGIVLGGIVSPGGAVAPLVVTNLGSMGTFLLVKPYSSLSESAQLLVVLVGGGAFGLIALAMAWG